MMKNLIELLKCISFSKRIRRLARLKRKANKLHNINQKQYFIIPVNTRGVLSYSLMNNELHKQYNKTAKKMKKKPITYPELLKMAVYKTPAGHL